MVDASATTYEASNNSKHTDLAGRWAHSFDVYDMGVHWYKGTNRTPLLTAVTSNGQTVLSAHYQAIEQIGLDLQATVGNWLWKGELIHQTNPIEDFWASQLGTEYTFYGLQDSATDLGVLFEYGKDQRCALCCGSACIAVLGSGVVGPEICAWGRWWKKELMVVDDKWVILQHNRPMRWLSRWRSWGWDEGFHFCGVRYL